MNEIITDYLDAKQLADRLTALELHSTSELARLERERDEARIDAKKSKAYKRVLKETNLRQTERIRYLEGATNHASGTPLSVALRERDEAQEKYATEATEHMLAVNKLCNERDEAQADCLEQARLLGMGSEREARLISERDDAREEAAHWKSEWEIVEARLCGWKHPRDNGIIFEHEVIPVLRKERDEAKNEILGWENKWKCAVDMAARAELERDEALKCAKEYYVEFIRNASSDNKISKPNPLNPFYKY
jgi:hypothetical protein